MKWVFYSGGVLLLIVAVILIWGALLPVGHVATTQVHVKASPEEIWTSLTDLEAFPGWRDDVERVSIVQDRELPLWKEYGAHGALTFAMVEADPPRRLVTRIADSDLPFGGSWTYEIFPEEEGCRVTITEQGEVYNIVFRFVSKYIIGHTATMDAFLANLSRKHES